MKKFSLIITAGGTSSRYGKENKLLAKIDNKTVIEHSIEPFLSFNEIEEVIVPANMAITEELKNILTDDKIKIIQGGATRQESVYKALKEVKTDYVIIHDGARPLITKEIINDVINKVLIHNAISVMTRTTDTIKEVDSAGKIIRTIDRSKLYNTQTPQAFLTELIKDAHEKLKSGSYTDDCSMLEELGVNVYISEGSPQNIKITSKSDLDFAKLYI